MQTTRARTMGDYPVRGVIDRTAMTDAPPRRGVQGIWGALPPPGRVALLGVLASAVVAIALGVYIPLEIRRHLLDAEGRGLEAAVAALQPSLPRLDGGPIDPVELDRLDRLIDRTLLDSDHVRAKLWSLDGVVLYSDEHALIGQSFPDVRPRLQEVAQVGVPRRGHRAGRHGERPRAIVPASGRVLRPGHRRGRFDRGGVRDLRGRPVLRGGAGWDLARGLAGHRVRAAGPARVPRRAGQRDPPVDEPGSRAGAGARYRAGRPGRRRGGTGLVARAGRVLRPPPIAGPRGAPAVAPRHRTGSARGPGRGRPSAP